MLYQCKQRTLENLFWNESAEIHQVYAKAGHHLFNYTMTSIRYLGASLTSLDAFPLSK